MSEMNGDHQWDERFESLVRAALGSLPADQILAADLDLPRAGLDSLAVVELLIQIEDAYQLIIPDELLTFATFATPGALWRAVAGLSAEVA
ncbi:phosphopantetheine-binding protein [Streptomyces sp. Wh19]|uniref:phosphopantetheine-binding protein n=1 Tax=Streptomyces sp. Wh19 TaxID=3076629 RepID=UPI002958B074|nr:phosphopantetheine-binding protein [Streptomyces sp. Wh19]MDV9194474.1 phosphopantetheine-binding protein [Streptomyces sp. Wh19]